MHPLKYAFATLLISTVLVGQASWHQVAGPGNTVGSYAVTYDSARDNVVVHYSKKTFTWSGASWSEFVTGSPQPVSIQGGMAFDRARSVVVALGMMPGSPSYFTLEWDGANWTKQYSAFAGERLGVMCYDEQRQVCVYVFNGSGITQVWEYNGVQWFDASPGIIPASGWRMALAYDRNRKAAVLVLGTGSNGATQETWEHDGLGWSLRDSTTVGAALSRVMTYDPVRQRMVCLVGLVSGKGQTMEWNGQFWVTRTKGLVGGMVVFDELRGKSIATGSGGGSSPSGTYEYRVAINPASYDAYGASCGPRLSPRPGYLPLIGLPFEVEMTSIPASASAAFMILGFDASSWFGQFPLPFDLGAIGMPGCQLLTRGDLMSTLTVQGGQARWSIQIPNDPGLVGQDFYNQGFVHSPGSNALGIVATDGRHGVFGRL